MVENKLILYYKDDIEGEKAFNGIVITEYNYSDDLMGKTQLSGSFMYPNTSLLELFDKKQYTYFRDNKFYLINPPSLSKEYGTDNGMTKYNCVFTSEKDLLDNIPFTDLVPANDSTRYFTASRDFKFYGDIAEFGHRLYANLSENTDIPYVINIKGVIMNGSVERIASLRNTIQTKFAEFTFSYTSVFAALNLMYENFKEDNLIWYLKNINYSGVIKPTIFITNTVSNIGDFKNPTHIFQYGQGKGLEKISVEPTNNDILTRISGHGSTQNIPFDYPIIYNGNTKVNHPYKRNYLMPNIFIEKLNRKYNTFNPTGYDANTIIIDYYDANDETYPNNINSDFPLINKEPIEFDIKPSIEGIIVGGNNIDQVKSVITTDFTEAYDENTGDYDQSTFQIKLHPLGFDLYGHANEKEEMTINMTSGKCVGCAFKVNIDENWLPSYDKKLFRCITDRPSPPGVYNPNDWFPFFNGGWLNAVGWWDMMQIVNYYTNPQQPITFVSPSMALSISNIWIDNFRPLRNYYDLIAQSVYGTNDYQNKYLVRDYRYPYERKPIQDYVDAIMTTLQANGSNHQNTHSNLMFELKYLLSDKNESVVNTLPTGLYNGNGEIAGYKKAILDLEYYFLRNPIPIGDYETIITTTNLPAPETPYGIGDLWVSSLRVSNDSNYPDSTTESIVITLEKDINTFGTMLPTNNISIEAEDTFVITGINLPQSYVDDAQDRLDIALKERLLADNVDKLNYSIPFDEKFIVENPTLRKNFLRCGNKISFKVSDNLIVRTIKQLSIEVSDNNPLPKYTCSVSDEFKLRSTRPIIDTDRDGFFRRLDDTMITLDNRIDDIGRTANLGAGRFVPQKLYELGDTLDVIGEKPEGLKVFGELDSIEALSKTAKNVADNKNKCWTSKPIPPYYAGDQWLVSNTDADADFLEGDTLFCKTTSQTNSFVSTDWSKTKYTRDIDFDDVIGLEDRPIGKKVFGDTDSLSNDISTTNSRFGTLPKDINDNERTVSDLIGNIPVGQKVIEITNSLSNDISTTNNRFGTLPKDINNNERTVSDLIGNVPVGQKVIEITNSLSNDISITNNNISSLNDDISSLNNDISTTNSRFGTLPKDINNNERTVSDLIGSVPVGQKIIGITNSLSNDISTTNSRFGTLPKDIDNKERTVSDLIGDIPIEKKVFGNTDSLSKDISTTNNRFGTLPKDINNNERTVSDLIGNVPVGQKVIEITNSLSNDISITNNNISSLNDDISSLNNDISTTNSRFGTLPKDINNNERTVSDLIGNVPVGQKIIGITNSLSNDISTTNSRFGTLPKDIDNKERTVSDLIGDIPIEKKVFGNTDSLSKDISTTNNRFGTLPKDINNNERTVSDLIGNVPVGQKVIEITNSLSNDISITNNNISSLNDDISSLNNDISTTNSRFGTLPKDINNNERTVSDLIGNVPVGQKIIGITNSLNNRVQASENKIGSLPLDEYGNERPIGSIIGNTAQTKTIFGERDSIEYLISLMADKLNNKKPLTLNGNIDGSNKVFETDKIFHMGFGDLYLNGVKQFRGVDYQENTSNKIEFLGTPPKTGDVIVFEATENTDRAIVVFKDEVVKDICNNILGVLTYNSVSLINSLGSYFKNNIDIITFSELQYFVGLGVINTEAFQFCSSLETINMPNSIHTIEDSAFQGCSNLQNVIIPKSVKVIGDYSFSGCNNITSITIPYLVGNIGDECFSNCINLTSVIVESLTPPVLGAQCFPNDEKLEAIYVPESSVASYQAAPEWNNYEDKIKPIEY